MSEKEERERVDVSRARNGLVCCSQTIRKPNYTITPNPPSVSHTSSLLVLVRPLLPVLHAWYYLCTYVRLCLHDVQAAPTSSSTDAAIATDPK